MDKNEKLFKEQAHLYKEMKNAFNTFENAYLRYRKTLKNDMTWRNTKIAFWKEICAKYDEQHLLNCYGDIYYVIKEDDYLVGRRVLWSLELSDELYLIQQEEVLDEDGNVDFIKYIIDCKGEKHTYGI